MLKFFVIGVVGVAVFAVAMVFVAHLVWDRRIAAEVAALETNTKRQNLVITGEMLTGLPRPVQRYLINAGVVGRRIPTLVRLTQTGHIRSSAEADWMSFEAEQVYSVDPPAFVWRAWLPGKSMPMVMGRDVYLEGESSILMRMGSLITMAEAQGDDLIEAGLMRYLNEVMWFPQAYFSDAISWEAIDDTSARVTMTDRGRSVSAVLTIDPAGQITNFTAERFNTDTGQMETWETPISRYGVMADLNLPLAGQAVWVLESGEFAYIELGITSVEFE